MGSQRDTAMSEGRPTENISRSTMPTGQYLRDQLDERKGNPWSDRDVPPETIAQFERKEIDKYDFDWLCGKGSDNAARYSGAVAVEKTVKKTKRKYLTKGEMAAKFSARQKSTDAAYVAACVARKESRRGPYTGPMKKARFERGQPIKGKLYTQSDDLTLPWDDST